MAVLSDPDRSRVWRGLMRAWSANGETVAGITKTDLLAAVNALDDFLNTNATSVNNALPTAFKNNATTGQKGLLLAAVALARYNIPALRQLLGEVD
jgi:hypothetical protein